MNKKNTVAVSGYFDPIHVGHLEYLELAKKIGDYLIVIVNNDFQASLKKGKSFMNEKANSNTKSLLFRKKQSLCLLHL